MHDIFAIRSPLVGPIDHDRWVTSRTIVATLACLVLTGFSVAACAGDPQITPAQVVAECKSLERSSVFGDHSISEDEGGSIVVEMDGIRSIEGVGSCALGETGAPKSVGVRIKEASDETDPQTASWDGWEAVWTRHGHKTELTIIPTHLGR